MAIDAAGNTTTLALLDASKTGGISTGDGDDTLTGNDADNVLDGRAGNDQLTGGKGRDRLIGGQGEDSASYEFASKGVTASLLKPRDNTNEAKGDTYSSIEDLRGSHFNDTFVGNNRVNFFFGNDGADKFEFLIANKGSAPAPDGIYDFREADHDKIVLSHREFGSLAHAHDHLKASAFKDIGMTTDIGNHACIVYNSKNGLLSYDHDGAGGHDAVAIAYLTNLADLSVKDFLYI